MAMRLLIEALFKSLYIGGTTIAGIAEMEKYGVRNAIICAIEAATKRGEELGSAPSRSSK
jgi:hypothetical protein